MDKEYIEREALLKKMEELYPLIQSINLPRAIQKFISEAPAGDVVEVVRCRDCKYIVPVEGGLPLCALHNIARAYNDFCSDGARMDGGG